MQRRVGARVFGDCVWFSIWGALVAGLVIGCASWNKGASTRPTTTTTTAASTKPVNEVVSVELNTDQGVFAVHARGMLRPGPSPGVPTELLAPLGAMGKDAPVLVTLGDVVKFDGTFPGEKGKWDKWDQGVEELVRKQQSSGAATIYELWKEPNEKPFSDRLNFFSCWVHTARNIRRMAPDAVLMGPGISKHDGGWITEFLKMCKEYNVLPDIVSWHEDGLKHDISGHLGGTVEGFWQDGTNVPRVMVSANAGIDNRDEAANPAIFLAQMDKAVRDNGWRPAKQEFAFKLSHLVTNEGKARSVYYAYRQYAALLGAGKQVKLNSSPTVDGLAVWDKAKRTGMLLLGRNRSRVDAKQVLGTVTLHVKGANGAVVHVSGSRIANSGAKVSEGPVNVVEKDYPLKNGEAFVLLPSFNSLDGYVVKLTVSGTPTTATTRSATTSTTRRASVDTNVAR